MDLMLLRISFIARVRVSLVFIICCWRVLLYLAIKVLMGSWKSAKSYVQTYADDHYGHSHECLPSNQIVEGYKREDDLGSISTNNHR